MDKKSISTWWEENRIIVFFLSAILVILILLNSWLWPTPDEYLYALVARSILAGARGEICLSCFNTEHTYLVSGVTSLYQLIFGIKNFDLVLSRIPIIFFSLVTIVLFWLIAKQVVREQKERAWFLILLLMIPGFFTLSVKMLLDVPLTFGFALLTYLLIIRSKIIWIGLALTIILLIKDYGYFLAAGLIVLVFITDIFTENGKWLVRLARFFAKIGFVFFPSLLVMALILGFDILPYPRLLETALKQYFGDYYLLITDNILPLFRDPNQLSAGSSNGVTAVQSIANRISSEGLRATIPEAIFTSPVVAEETGGMWHKLWLIYKYNFSEQDLMIFTLPLFFVGLISRTRLLLSRKLDWPKSRNDLIFLFLLFIYAYVNWHEALNIHGFRLTIPVIVSIVYFSYFGARSILIENKKTAKVVFGVLLFAFMAMYFIFLGQIGDYGSVISEQQNIALLLKFKQIIFGLLFLSGFVYMWRYSTLKWKHKEVLLACYIIGLFALKLVPFYLEAKASSAAFGKNYELAEASPYLEQIRQNNGVVLTNIHHYTLDYYAGSTKLSNQDNFPVLRPTYGTPPAIHKFKEVYIPFSYIFRTNTPRLDNNLVASSGATHIFFANRSTSNQEVAEFEATLSGLGYKTQLVAEHRNNSNGFLQWQIYQIVLSAE
ncbi:MAG: hypothetical protein WCT32_02425 [Patescibacteria group bacterium]|jgi:hypothetical protein